MSFYSGLYPRILLLFILGIEDGSLYFTGIRLSLLLNFI